MSRSGTTRKKFLSVVLSLLMVFSIMPTVTLSAYGTAANPETADLSTIDGWKTLFGDPQSGNISTKNAGKVWTDKSVFTDLLKSGDVTINATGENSMLVALSAMASNTSVTGTSSVPTDTMLVLDVSGSMDKGHNKMASSMVDAANESIATLLSTNKFNRVGVIVYSGQSQSSSNDDTAIVLLPLDRYETGSDGQYINYDLIERTYWQSEVVSVDNDTVIENTNTKPAAVSKNVTGATYIQKGIILAKEQFDKVSDITVNDPALGVVKRMPVMVLMSDGAPTLSSTDFTNPKEYNLGNGRTTSAAQGFVSQLTASYAKQAIEEKYNNDSLFYTLGLGVGNNAVAISVLNPVQSDNSINEFWRQYNNAAVGGTVTVSSGFGDIKKVTKIDESLSQNYVDGYFSVDNLTDDDLKEAFKNIVKNIQLQSKYFPTLVKDDEDLDGYVSFVDKIGKYMNVSEIKGVMVDGNLFTGAELAARFMSGQKGLGTPADSSELGDEYVASIMKRLGVEDESVVRTLIENASMHGQLRYVNDSDFSNYVGWYSDADGKYLGFWYDGISTAVPDGAKYIVKSYSYLGQISNENNITSDMMYITVRHRTEIATGEESIAFAVPAALIPVVTYEIGLDGKGNLKSIEMKGAENPISLVYEVELDKRIDQLSINNVVDADYLAQNTDKSTGEVYFYTNQYEADGSVGYGKVNTYSYFNPSRQNEMYYYASDSIVYSDSKGTVYDGEEAPSRENDYYRAVKVFEKAGTSLKTNTVYERIADNVLTKAVKNTEKGSWFIKAGTVHTEVSDMTVYKDSSDTSYGGKTDTLKFVSEPYVDINNHDVDETGYSYYVGATLGNNGRIAVTPATGISISKTVAQTNNSEDAPDSFIFNIKGDMDKDAGKTYEAFKESSQGELSAMKVSFDKNAEAKFSLKDGETIYITGLSGNSTYVVTEVQTAFYKISSIDNSNDSDSLTLTTEKGKIVGGTFVNTERGKGTLTLTKVVEHDFDNDPEALSDMTFKINGTMEGPGVQNMTFEAEDSLEKISSIRTDSDGKFEISLKANQQVQINDLPEGTRVIISESDLTAGFEAAYYLNSNETVTGRDAEVVIGADEIQSVIIKNKYTPDPVSPSNISITGTKNYDGSWDNEVFTVELQKSSGNGNDWITVATESLTDTARGFDFTGKISEEVFDAPGTYNYRIVEVRGDSPKDYIIYDSTVHSFGVVVTDEDMDGHLEISDVKSFATGSSFQKDEEGNFNVVADFSNKYTSEGCSVTIDIDKTLVNQSGSTKVSKAGFEFGLYDGNKLIKKSAKTDNTGSTHITLEFDGVNDLGTHNYTLKEIIPESADRITGMSYDSSQYQVKVDVTGASGKSEAVATISKGNETVDTATFTNTYRLNNAKVTIDDKVKKELKGRELKAGEFSFEVREISGGDSWVVATGVNDKNGNVDFDKNELIFSKVGTYNYLVKETSTDGKGVTTDKNQYNVTITVSDDGKGNLVAKDVVENTVNDETITFRNVYEAEDVQWNLTGSKTLTGKELSANEFTFDMIEVDEDGNKLSDGKSWSVGNDADGNITFPVIEFNETGQYYYKVSERAGSLGYIGYDKTAYYVTVNVSDDGEGQLAASHDIFLDKNKEKKCDDLSFENVYNADDAKVVLKGTKILENKDLKADDYSFSLHSSDESWTLGQKQAAAKNDSKGDFAFNEMTFQREGTYYYIIREDVPADAEGGTLNGVTYDDNEYRIAIEVKDNKCGKLVETVKIYDKEGVPQTDIEFVNIYEAASGTLRGLSFNKVLTGRDMSEGEFLFELKDETGDLVQDIASEEAKSGEKQTLTFDEITFEEEGEYKYYLTEVIPEDAVKKEIDGKTCYVKNGVIYDASEYEVTIKVTDNKTGVLQVEASYDGLGDGIPTFKNSYKPEAETYELLGITKTLTGRDMKAGEFTFQLINEQGMVIATGKNQAAKAGEAAPVKFEEITFKEAGIYKYLIKEVAGQAGGVEYSSESFEIIIQVTDNLQGELSAEVVSDTCDDEICVSKVEFVNSYKADSVGYIIDGMKKLIGRELKGNEFNFELYRADENFNRIGSVIDTAPNDENGYFSFNKIEFTKVGTYHFIVVESDVNADAQIKYDKTVFLLTVEVKDDGNGKLSVDVTKKAKGLKIADADEIQFINTFVPETPKTGDSSHVGLWTVMMAIGATGFLGLAMSKKDEEDE